MFGGGMSDDDHAAAKFVAPADFDGPTKHRHCTDILCVLLIWLHWAALTGIGIYAIQNGDYRLVLFPIDYDGNVCGTDFAADMTEYPNLLYVNSYTGGVCVKECPDLNNKTIDNLTDIRTLITYNGTWQVDGSQLPLDYVKVADYSQSNDTRQCTEALCYPNNNATMSWNSLGILQSYGYAYYAASTYTVLNRCYVTTEAEERILEQVQANATTVIDIENNPFVDKIYDFWNRLFADIYVARNYVFGFGFGVSLGISLIYIFLFRFPGILASVIWTSIAATITLFGVGGYYAWNQARIWDSAIPKTVDDQAIQATTVVSYILWIICAFLALMACCLRRSIGDAIVCTKQAGKAVNSMIMILFVPVLQTIGFFIYMIPFVIYAVNLASLGTITTTEVPLVGDLPGGVGASVTVRSFEFDTFVERCGWVSAISVFCYTKVLPCVSLTHFLYCFHLL
jgi:Plasma-membrane choline transporter